MRQAHALGKFVTDPKHAECFHLVAPAARAAEGRRPGVAADRAVGARDAPRRSRRPDPVRPGRRGHAVVHRQPRAASCSTMNGGCTVIIDPEGDVRYSIYKKFDSENRRARQHAAITGPLKSFWVKDRKKWKLRPEMLKRLHAGR